MGTVVCQRRYSSSLAHECVRLSVLLSFFRGFFMTSGLEGRLRVVRRWERGLLIYSQWSHLLQGYALCEEAQRLVLHWGWVTASTDCFYGGFPENSSERRSATWTLQTGLHLAVNTNHIQRIQITCRDAHVMSCRATSGWAWVLETWASPGPNMQTDCQKGFNSGISSRKWQSWKTSPHV